MKHLTSMNHPNSGKYSLEKKRVPRTPSVGCKTRTTETGLRKMILKAGQVYYSINLEHTDNGMAKCLPPLFLPVYETILSTLHAEMEVEMFTSIATETMQYDCTFLEQY